ncbi:hypothetical protein KSP40_PGU004786 [Platanthera guangdongensis]|uniref:Uncharacterized protein n=1 Tax=Platanthera guangdongensis TaxID=2320717 RepID=A0ABR2MP61_9ASPA
MRCRGRRLAVLDIVDRLFVTIFDYLNEKCKKLLDAINKQFPFKPLKHTLLRQLRIRLHSILVPSSPPLEVPPMTPEMFYGMRFSLALPIALHLPMLTGPRPQFLSTQGSEMEATCFQRDIKVELDTGSQDLLLSHWGLGMESYDFHHGKCHGSRGNSSTRTTLASRESSCPITHSSSRAPTGPLPALTSNMFVSAFFLRSVPDGTLFFIYSLFRRFGRNDGEKNGGIGAFSTTGASLLFNVAVSTRLSCAVNYPRFSPSPATDTVPFLRLRWHTRKRHVHETKRKRLTWEHARRLCTSAHKEEAHARASMKDVCGSAQRGGALERVKKRSAHGRGACGSAQRGGMQERIR